MTGSVHALGRSNLQGPQEDRQPDDHAQRPHARQALIVLGMHRSGTSALAGALAMLGARFGDRLMPADHNNPNGYWENLSFVERNDRLLRALGLSWDAPCRMPEGWADSPPALRFAARLRQSLDEEFGNADTIAIKDPRLCRLVPLWDRVLVDAGYRPAYLLALRHPEDVAGSLARRDGFSREKSHLLWLQHFVEAEAATRGLVRSVVVYDELIADWSTPIARITRDLSARWPTAPAHASSRLSGFLKPSPHHHAGGNREALGPSDPLAFVHDIYHRWVRRARAQDRGQADAIEIDREQYARLLETVLAQSTRDRHLASRKSAHLNRRLKDAVKAQSVVTHAQRVVAELPPQAPASPQTRRAPVHDLCKVYWRQDGQDYREDAAVGLACVFGQIDVDFEADCPCAGIPDFLRIDPSEWPGIFSLDRISIDGHQLDAAAAHVSLINGHRLEGLAGDLRFAALDADPHVEFDLRHLRRENDVRTTLRIGFHVARAEVQSELARLSSRDLAMQHSLCAQQRDLAAIRSGLETMRTQSREHGDSLKVQGGRHLSDIATIRGAVEVCQSLLDQHADVLDSVIESNAALQASSHELALRLDGMCGSIGDMTNDMTKRIEATIQENSGADAIVSAIDSIDRRMEGIARTAHVGMDALQARIDTMHAHFDAADAERTIVLNWMRRRSPGYWWRRWFRG